MTRRYGHPIAVTHSEHGPLRFRWNSAAYQVVELLGMWHLRDRWWEGGAASDRYYYRVRCASGLIADLYHDIVSDAWVLDCVYD